MLQSRHLKIVFICLIITKLSEQSLGQGYSKKNLQAQQRQPQNGGGPQHRQDEERKILLLEKARDVRRYIDLSHQPCKDLYDYACGNWLQFQNLSDTKAGDRISVVDQLERQINIQLQEMLKVSQKTTEYEDTAVKQFYRSCTQAAASSPDQREYIKTFVEHHGGLPYVRDSRWQEKHYNWINVIGQLKHRYNLDILISLTIPKTSQGRVIPILEEPQRTVLPPHLCSSLAAQYNEEKDDVFKQIQIEIKDNLRAWLDLDDTDAVRVAGDILTFEFDLCKYMRKWEMVDIPNGEGRGNHSKANYNYVVPNKIHGVLQNVNNNAQQLNALEAKYNLEFTRFVHVSLGKGHSTPREFYCRSEEYFQHLNNISRRRLTPSFAYYIMYRALSEITIPRNQPTAERPFYCVRKALQFFPDILGNLYQRKYRRDDVLSDLRDMFKNIREAFVESLDLNGDWLQDTFRKDIQLRTKSWKLKEPEYQGGVMTSDLNVDSSPNYWKLLDTVMEYSAQQYLQQLSTYPTIIQQHLEEYVITIPTNAETRLHFSWALLQPPFYAYNYPRALKYSTVGSIMASELVRHYDQQGWHENPPPIVNAWHFDTMDGFNRNKECFRIQMSNYFFNSPNVFRNGTQLRQLADDASAVNIAFAAYNKWLQDQVANTPDLQFETLPDMDFSNTQLFFINYAQSRCAVRHMTDVAGASEFFPMDRHTLERLNVNGPLSNGYEFGRDFNCLVGSEMNVDDKCLIF